mmetsp:Transcript_7778/g.19779  ORF Transcript_7778/g.19779 Transcript_7778/m.19779 type:complete len:337 (+) Transcript_7778:776-1786(+)
MIKCSDRVYGADSLNIVQIQNAAHLQSSEAVDPELHPVLRVLVEHRGRPLQQVPEDGLVPELGPFLEPSARGRGRLAVQDFEGGGPGPREKRACAIHGEITTQKVILALLQNKLFLLGQVPQLVHVAEVGDRGHKTAALGAPVRELRVENAPQEVPVLFFQAGRMFAIHHIPKGIAEDKATPAAGLRRRRDPLHLAQLEAVQAEVHAAELPELSAPLQPGGPRHTGLREPVLLHQCWHPLATPGPRRVESAKRQHAALRQWRCGASRCNRREIEPAEAKVDASIDTMHAAADSLLRIHNLAVFDPDLGVTLPVPQLRNFQMHRVLDLCIKVEPRVA